MHLWCIKVNVCYFTRKERYFWLWGIKDPRLSVFCCEGQVNLTLHFPGTATIKQRVCAGADRKTPSDVALFVMGRADGQTDHNTQETIKEKKSS